MFCQISGVTDAVCRICQNTICPAHVRSQGILFGKHGDVQNNVVYIAQLSGFFNCHILLSHTT